MTRFLKKKSKLVVALIFGLVLPAFLLPSTHFHSEYIHNQPNQVSSHKHQAHFHSEVLEAYAHFINNHPSDPAQDKKYHNFHSSPDHDKDDVELYKVQKNIPTQKSILVVKHVDFPVSFEDPRALISYRVGSEIPTFNLSKIPRIQSSRSPPYISI